MSNYTLFNASVKMSFKTAFLLQMAVLAVTFIATAVVGEVAQAFIAKRIQGDWSTLALVLIMISLFLLVTLTSWLILGLASIDRRIGLRVRYVERDGNRAILFRELRNIIKQAKSRIVIVNTNISDTSDEDADAETANERRLYLLALLERVRGGGVTYHRIIQAEDKASLAVFRGERLRHFHEMLDAKISYGSKVGLTRAADTRPLTFTLVDDHWMMLEIDQRDSRGLHMEGILIFDDPQQTVIGDFERYYQSLSLSSNKGSIERSDLPEISGSPDKVMKGESFGRA